MEQVADMDLHCRRDSAHCYRVQNESRLGDWFAMKLTEQALDMFDALDKTSSEDLVAIFESALLFRFATAKAILPLEQIKNLYEEQA